MRRLHSSSPALVLALLLAACDTTPEPSDAGHYQLEIGLDNPLGSHSQLALVGSQFGVSIRDLPGDDGEDVAADCIEQTASGALAQLSPTEYRVDAAGPGAVELDVPASGCPSDAVFDTLAPDRWSLTGVDASEVSGRWAATNDAAILDNRMSPGSRGAFPQLLGRPLDELLVAADHAFVASPALVLAGSQTEVRWHDDARELRLPAHFEDLRPISEVNDLPLQRLEGSLGAGESFDASIELLGNAFALPQVRAVPSASISSLELVPVYWPGDAQREWGAPAAVLAIAVDGDGRRVMGAPVEFSLTRGSLAIEAEHDVLLIDDMCRDDPPGLVPRAATVVAQVGDVVASTDLDWVGVPGQQGVFFEDDSNCVGQTCTCSSTAAPGESALGLLMVVGLGLCVRRRKHIRPIRSEHARADHPRIT